MKTVLSDFVVFFLAALLALFVQDVFGTPRSERHANEQRYMACVQQCMGPGNMQDRIWGKK